MQAAPWRRTQQQWEAKSSAKADAEDTAAMTVAAPISTMEESRAKFAFYILN